jgi:hypothetical protein
LQIALALQHGGDYRFALGSVAAAVALAIVLVVALGKERKGIEFGRQT